MSSAWVTYCWPTWTIPAACFATLIADMRERPEALAIPNCSIPTSADWIIASRAPAGFTAIDAPRIKESSVFLGIASKAFVPDFP